MELEAQNLGLRSKSDINVALLVYEDIGKHKFSYLTIVVNF